MPFIADQYSDDHIYVNELRNVQEVKMRMDLGDCFGHWYSLAVTALQLQNTAVARNDRATITEHCHREGAGFD